MGRNPLNCSSSSTWRDATRTAPHGLPKIMASLHLRWTAGPTSKHRTARNNRSNAVKNGTVARTGPNYHTTFRSSKPRRRGRLSGCHLPAGPLLTVQHPHPQTPFLSSSRLTPRFELDTCLSTTRKRDSSHGSSRGPTLLNPYSSSARWRSCLKAGWLRYAVRTINRWELTDTATWPAGTSDTCPEDAAARALHRRSIWRRRTMQRILLLHFEPILGLWFGLWFLFPSWFCCLLRFSCFSKVWRGREYGSVGSRIYRTIWMEMGLKLEGITKLP